MLLLTGLEHWKNSRYRCKMSETTCCISIICESVSKPDVWTELGYLYNRLCFSVVSQSEGLQQQEGPQRSDIYSHRLNVPLQGHHGGAEGKVRKAP